ncbi:MAG TPA: hypothetical protein VFA98_03255 [Thermoanaerobaculia bacterium]|nr:hypothetical protein [Thermoanaerobaculia bacterium]
MKAPWRVPATLLAGLVLSGPLAAQAPAPAETPVLAPTNAPSLAPATTPAGPGPTVSYAAARHWTDPQGKPLPFGSEAEMLDFLRTADVVSATRLGGGINNPRKLLLQKNGVQANAVFRDVNEEKNTPTFGGGKNELFFKDSYIFEPAAYELATMLGLDNVPPATLRRYDRTSGSIQIFIENAITERQELEEHLQPPDDQEWKKQVQMMNVFDALIYNVDRNRGNIIITPDWRLWMIDHSRTFRRNTDLQSQSPINQCERQFYAKLKALDEKEARKRLKEYLTAFELDALFTRRKLLLERIDKLIAEKGENQVLYDFVWYPPKNVGKTTEETAAQPR